MVRLGIGWRSASRSPRRAAPLAGDRARVGCHHPLRACPDWVRRRGRAPPRARVGPARSRLRLGRGHRRPRQLRRRPRGVHPRRQRLGGDRLRAGPRPLLRLARLQRLSRSVPALRARPQRHVHLHRRHVERRHVQLPLRPAPSCSGTSGSPIACRPSASRGSTCTSSATTGSGRVAPFTSGAAFASPIASRSPPVSATRRSASASRS